MSPLDQAGNYQMNPEISRASSAMAPPMAGTGPKSITLTEQPDGSITCDDGSGKPPTPYSSVDDALAAAKTALGGDDTSMGQTTGDMPDGASSDTSSDS